MASAARAFAFIVALAAILSSSAGAVSVINVCMSMTSIPAQSLRASLGAEATRGLAFLTEWLDAKGGFNVGNQTYRFNIIKKEDYSNSTIMIGNYRQFVADPTCHFLFGPMQSDFNIIAAAAVTEGANRLLLAHNAASDAFHVGRKKAYAIMPAASRYMTAAFAEARVREIRNISITMSPHPVHTSSCAPLPYRLAPDNGIDVASFHYIPENPVDYYMEPATIPNITATAEAIMKVGADAVVLCSFPSNNGFMVDYWKSKNYMPKLVIINGFGVMPYLNWTNNEYITGVESWDPSARYPADIYFGTMDDLLVKWKARWPEHNLAFASMNALYTGIALMEAIQRAKTIEEEAVTFALSRLDIDTLKGRIAWSGDHAQLGLAVYMQIRNNTWKTVGPLNARSANLIYPLPKWDEREYISKPYSLKAEWGVTVLFAVGILSNIVFFVLLLRYWTHPVVRASSPLFLSITLLGTTILYSAMWVWMPSLVTYASCHLRFWMLAIGFGITFGALFAKTWRVWSLYSNRSTEIFRILDWHLGMVLGFVIAIELILCILVSSISDPHVTYLVPDPLRPALNTPVCMASTSQLVLTIILAVYNGIIILVGIYLGIRVRVIPISMFNESKTIGLSIYNASFFSIIMGALQASEAGDRTTLFVLMSLALFFGCIGTTASLFVSKWVQINKNNKSRHGSSTTTPRGTSGSGGVGSTSLKVQSQPRSGATSSVSAAPEITVPMEKYEKLKKKVRQLRSELRQYKAIVEPDTEGFRAQPLGPD